MTDNMEIDPPTNNHDNNSSSNPSHFATPLVTYASVAGRPPSSQSNTSNSKSTTFREESSKTHKGNIKGGDSENKRKRQHSEKPYERSRETKPSPFMSQDDFFNTHFGASHTPGFYESLSNVSDSNVGNQQQPINTKPASAAEYSETVPPVTSKKRKQKKTDRNTKNNNDEQKNDDNSNRDCQCQPLIPVFPVSYCDCRDNFKYQDEAIDFDYITSQDIPDTKKPMIAKKHRLVNIILGPLCGGYENENKPTHNSYFSTLLKSFLDPLLSKETSSISSTSHSNSNSNSHDHGSSHSSHSTTNHNLRSNNSSNGASSHASSSNSNLQDSLFTTTGTHKTPPIRLLVLHIAFGRYPNKSDINKCHSKGYHPIVVDFKDGNDAFHFVRDSIINCWSNSWKIALVVSYDLTTRDNLLNHFFRNIREEFESDILDIILLKSSYSYLSFTRYLEITVVNYDSKQDFNKAMEKVISKAYQRNKYDNDDILFYNKDEPYYEFTNFYRAQIKIEDEIWPTTEHYFQAAKFHSRYLRNKIRFAYTAREAFIIARSNNDQKRKDWESPMPPDGQIFKESVMRNALFEKFSQHIKLRYKLLSTGKAKIYEHTENDQYWGDGGKNNDGLNRLGIMLQEIRNMFMEGEKCDLVYRYGSNRHEKWVVTGLKELKQFDDLIELD